jgi:hypothetical protein
MWLTFLPLKTKANAHKDKNCHTTKTGKGRKTIYIYIYIDQNKLERKPGSHVDGCICSGSKDKQMGIERERERRWRLVVLVKVVNAGLSHPMASFY